MKEPDTAFVKRGAMTEGLRAIEAFLKTLEIHSPLSDEVRDSAADAARAVGAACLEWQQLDEESQRLRQQVAALRAELGGLELTVGRVYTALEEEAYASGPRGPAGT